MIYSILIENFQVMHKLNNTPHYSWKYFVESHTNFGAGNPNFRRANQINI